MVPAPARLRRSSVRRVDRARLARTVEEVIDPEVELCDPHHHLWAEPTMRYPRYDLEDLHADTGAGHRVTSTVFVECMAAYRTDGPEALRPVGETAFVAGRADRSDRSDGARIAAIVGFADLTLGAAVDEVLAAHVEAAGGRFRGIRHAAGWDASPDVPNSHTDPPADLYDLASFRAGMRTLAARGLSFDAWQYHPTLPRLVALARAVPEATIVVNHLGAPLGIGPYAGRRSEVLASWWSSMAELAACPNVVLKLGGIGMPRYGAGWERLERPPTSDDLVDLWGDEIRRCIDAFGPDRCMFESNYPVDGESVGYVVLWNAFKRIAASYDRSERDALLRGTAVRTYRIEAADSSESHGGTR